MDVILLSELWYIRQIYTIPKYIKKQIDKRIRPPIHLVQLSIWKGGLGILDIDTH